MINTTIGMWTEDRKKIRNEIKEFVEKEWNKRKPQIGSLLYNKLNHPRMWEYASAISMTNPDSNKIIDVGGLNNVFGWFLSLKRNCEVFQTGLSKNDLNSFIENKNFAKNCKIKAEVSDVINITGQYDIVYCINVIEHVREKERHRICPSWKQGLMHYWNHATSRLKEESEAEIKFVKALTNLVSTDGFLCITFDFKKHGSWKCQNKCAYFRGINDILERIIVPSGLTVIGDMDYETIHTIDCHPPASTGIIVLKK